MVKQFERCERIAYLRIHTVSAESSTQRQNEIVENALWDKIALSFIY